MLLGNSYYNSYGIWVELYDYFTKISIYITNTHAELILLDLIYANYKIK